jgi:hypothetical protein
MDARRCPVCASLAVVAGKLAVPGEAAAGFYFVPVGTRGPTWRTGGVRLPQVLHACAACGHLWTSVGADVLREFLARHGTELAQQLLAAREHGPGHDLPDCPEARQAATHTAEIDALVLEGRQPEATRRYRELARVTWDQAVDTVRTWRDLGRAEKLALFGWRPKEPAGDPGHPLHDRELDG